MRTNSVPMQTMSSISFKFFLRPSNNVNPKPDEPLRLCIKITADRKAKYLNTGYKLPAKYFDKEKATIIPYAKSFKDLKVLVEAELDELKQFAYRFELENGEKPTFSELETYWVKGPQNKAHFFDFAQSYIDENVSIWSKQHTMTNKSILKNLKIYAGNSRLGFKEINRKWILDFRKTYLDLGKSNNTVAAYIRFLKAVFNQAIQKKLTTEYPFSKISSNTDKSVKRNYLSLEEIKSLHDIFTDPKTDNNTSLCLRYFLFCCFTGLRLGDVRQLTWDSFDEGAIRLTTEKTKTPIVIPLSEAAKQYLIEGASHPFGRQLYTKGERINNAIKAAAIQAGITKEISFHVSRHTFASNAIMNNMDLIAVQRLLGHASSSTTEIYVKIVDDYLFKQMDKMPGLDLAGLKTDENKRVYKQPSKRKKGKV